MAADIVRSAAAKFKRVLFLAHRRKLVDQIAKRLGEYDVPRGIIMAGEKYSSALVQVASRDTVLSRVFNNEWEGMPPADLVIVDEGHRAANPESEYRRILEQYPQATILLLTATPVGPDGQGMGPWAEAIVCAAPTSKWIEAERLVPVRCYAPDRKVIRGKVQRKGIAGDLVESWKEYSEQMPTVLFCARVQHSLDAVAAFNAAGIPFAHVDADTPDEKRDLIFDDLASGHLKGVSNVGIMGEGVDVPALGCCQIYCNCTGRVKFLQAVGRVMRPYPGKDHAVLIDHCGAVFQHGFPDEDMEWPLNGNADAEYKKKHDEEETPKPKYCKDCHLVFDGPQCPQCGKMPTKPPKSIFAPTPVDSTDELLVAVDRDLKTADSRAEKEKHWQRCLAVAANRNGTFGMAAAIYKQKYNEWPDYGFVHMPQRWEWKTKVSEKHPGYRRMKK